MQITYSVQAADFDALSRQLKGTTGYSGRHFLRTISLLLVGVLTMSFVIYRLPGQRPIVRAQSYDSSVLNSPIVILLGYVLPLICFVGFYFFIAKRKLLNVIETNPDWSQPRVAEIAPEFLISRYASGESSSRWELMKKVAETDTHLFFLVTNIETHLIPKRAFDTEENAKLFAQTALSHWERAHPSEIQLPLPDPRN